MSSCSDKIWNDSYRPDTSAAINTGRPPKLSKSCLSPSESPVCLWMCTATCLSNASVFTVSVKIIVICSPYRQNDGLCSVFRWVSDLGLSLLMHVTVQVFKSTDTNLHDSVCESAESDNTFLLSVVSPACRRDDEILWSFISHCFPSVPV